MTRLDRAVEAAEKIPGWMEVEELEWLGEKAAECETVLEVGSYQGRSTKVLALMCPGKVISVDPLVGEQDPNPIEPDGGPCFGEELDRKFRRNLKAHIDSGKLEVIRQTSQAAARRFADGSLDMVFIDGNHVHPNPLEDALTWRRKLTRTGLLCGHDQAAAGVRQAMEIIGIGGRGPSSIWYDDREAYA